VDIIASIAADAVVKQALEQDYHTASNAPFYSIISKYKRECQC